MGGTHFLQTGYLLLNRNAPLFFFSPLLLSYPLLTYMTYRENGFQGVRPMDRQKRRSQAMPENFDELLKEAIQLRAY